MSNEFPFIHFHWSCNLFFVGWGTFSCNFCSVKEWMRGWIIWYQVNKIFLCSYSSRKECVHQMSHQKIRTCVHIPRYCCMEDRCWHLMDASALIPPPVILAPCGWFHWKDLFLNMVRCSIGRRVCGGGGRRSERIRQEKLLASYYKFEYLMLRLYYLKMKITATNNTRQFNQR